MGADDAVAPPVGARRWHRTLRAKMTGVVVTTTVAALVVALGAMMVYDLRAYHEAALEDMATQAELLGLTTAPALSFDDARLARENLSLLHLRRQVVAAAVYTRSGLLFATYAAGSQQPVFPQQVEADGVQVRNGDVIVFRRLVSNGEMVGTVYLQANYGMTSRLLSYGGIAAAVALLATAVAFVLSLRVQKIVTRPILAISRVAREVVEQKDYSRRAEQISHDEVGDLVLAFNELMAEVQRRTDELEQALAGTAREVSERRAMQAEVMRLNAELEQRVSDRTAQLEAMNRELALATDAAEHANQAKSEFISSMSHELRTPLNAILGFGQLLLSTSFKPTPEKRLEFMQHIVKSGHHLLKLINEILDLARIESGNLMLSLEPLALSDLLAECQHMIGPAADQRGIRLLFPTETRLGLVADRTRLQQVLLNLLSNAVKYNREGGSVIVDAQPAGEVSQLVRVSVQDTGPGLRRDQLDALFQPFNRLGQEAGAVQGTGIGLVVTKRLVELMGGRIGVTSTPGVGSVFWVEMKAAPGQRAGLPARPLDDGPPSGLGLLGYATYRPLLLHVEDNPSNLKLVEEIVALRGDLRQIAAASAQLGIELARAHAPRLILMDINMPGLSGADALAILRADPATSAIPVIAVTANAMPREKARALAAGFFRYVTKPIEMVELNEAIDAALAIDGGESPVDIAG